MGNTFAECSKCLFFVASRKLPVIMGLRRMGGIPSRFFWLIGAWGEGKAPEKLERGEQGDLPG